MDQNHNNDSIKILNSINNKYDNATIKKLVKHKKRIDVYCEIIQKEINDLGLNFKFDKNSIMGKYLILSLKHLHYSK